MLDAALACEASGLDPVQVLDRAMDAAALAEGVPGPDGKSAAGDDVGKMPSLTDRAGAQEPQASQRICTSDDRPLFIRSEVPVAGPNG